MPLLRMAQYGTKHGHAAGKLSDEDFALLDAELRREAGEILDREPV